MKKYFLTFCLILLFGGFIKKPADKVLIFSLTKGYHHASIADGIAAIKIIGLSNNFEVDTTTNPDLFTKRNLKHYKALIFLSPTGSGFFNAEQQNALKEFIHNGGGLVGIHAATDCLYDWDWYNKLIGAYFSKHPKIQEAKLVITDHDNPLTNMLPITWLHTDEWYNFKQVSKDIHVLLKVDETSYTGGDMEGNHPISWYQKFEGGRMFYTALGHTKESFTTDTLFLRHLTSGIAYALGRVN